MPPPAKYVQMTTAPVGRLVCRLAVPTVVIMLTSALYNMADTFFVSSLGTEATAALGVAFPFMAIIQAVGFFFGNGAGNYLARALGAQRGSDAAKMASTSFFTAFVFGLGLAALGLIFLTPLARLLGATPALLSGTVEYLRYILLAAPFMICAFMLNNCLRFQGNAFWSMIGMVSGAALNVALDPLFIFGFNWGLSGAALATMLSQIISFLILLFLSNGVKTNVPVSPRNFAPGLGLYRELWRGGLPSLLRQSLLCLSTIMINHAAGAFGDAVIAGISIVMRIIQTLSAAIIGIGQGLQPVCGFNYGAGLYERVRQAQRFCVKLTLAILSALSLICLLWAPWIVALFRTGDPEVVAVGAWALRLQALSLPLAGQTIIDNLFLQTIGRSTAASWIALSRQGLFLLPFLIIFARFFGVIGIQLCVPAADLCAFILAVSLSAKAFREAPFIRSR
ncbi:MAG: MATE family efflux transporter [Candidatus Margulisbacteria bacterium]|jgi:putative MATE family efflux protein|nr:MATE family efflux transporter [Candidatus Margulisiibacteriota bacterium]